MIWIKRLVVYDNSSIRTLHPQTHPAIRCPPGKAEMFINSPLSLLSVLAFLSSIATCHDICSKDKLQCDITKCISIRLRCDGEMHCKDLSDELHCSDLNKTVMNATNSTEPDNETSSHTTLSNSTTLLPTPPSKHKIGNIALSTPPKKREAKKFIRKRVNFNNHTKKRKIKRPFDHNKRTTWSPKQTLTAATLATQASPVTDCSAQECEKWRACWSDATGSRKCACDEVVCRRDWKAIEHAEKVKNKKMKDVFEWLAISLSSTGLLLATIVIFLKRRRSRRNTTRPLHVRTVVCYHNGQDDCACVGHGTAGEICPLYETTREEGNVCYIDVSGHIM